MNANEKAQKIQSDLHAKWPDARFAVTIDTSGVHVEFLGGNNHVDDFPTHEQAVKAMQGVIRQTLPNFVSTSWEVDGQTVPVLR